MFSYHNQATCWGNSIEQNTLKILYTNFYRQDACLIVFQKKNSPLIAKLKAKDIEFMP